MKIKKMRKPHKEGGGKIMSKEQNVETMKIPIQIEDESIEKLEKIKKLLDDIKISAQEVKDLFKHIF